MVQESIYSKLVLNGTAVQNVKKSVKQAAPKDGLVQMLVITEQQYQNIEFLTGTPRKDVVDSMERTVIL